MKINNLEARKIHKSSDFKDYYWVLTNGDIYKVTGEGDNRKELKMSPFITKDGYVEYVLTLNSGKKKHIQAQIAVGETWVGKPKTSKPYQWNHQDGNRKNNNKGNINAKSPSANIRHSFDVLGKEVWNKGKKKQKDGSYK